MKKILIPLLVILVASCGVKHEKSIVSPIDIEAMLAHGWDLYDSGYYEDAADSFNTVLNYDNTIIDAYLGYGFSLGMLGRLLDAKPVFRLAISVALGVTADKVMVEDSAPDPALLPDTVRVYLTHGPVLSIQKVTDPFANTYDVLYYGERVVGSDTIYFVDLAEDPETTVSVTYTYFDPSVIPTDPSMVENVKAALWAYCGESGLYVTTEEGEENNALNAALSSLHIFEMIDTTLEFNHRPYMNYEMMTVYAALASFRLGLYKNAVEFILKVDPDWTPPEDPFDPAWRSYILEELESLLGQL